MTGFYDMDAADPSTDTWYESFTIDTYPWDAGTDTGTTYLAADEAANPAEPIFMFTPDNVPDTGVFLSPNGTEILPMCTWTCTLQGGDSGGGSAAAGQHAGVVLAIAVMTSLWSSLFGI